MNNIFRELCLCGTYTHILSWNSCHNPMSWGLLLAMLYIWETGPHRGSTLPEILELEGSAMNLKLRSVSKTHTFNHCTGLLYLLHVNLC